MNSNYRPMLCPVCNDFFFSELQEGDVIDNFRCSRCGWKYDLHQAENPEDANGANSLSLIDYRKVYSKKVLENPDYDFSEENMPEPVPHMCPVCGRFRFKDEHSFCVCPFCGWEDDGADERPGEVGANGCSFSEYKRQYEERVNNDPQYKWKD